MLLDVKTNQVLAMVSYPTFDLNHFDDLYQQLHDDVINEPLRDRATESQLEPGSTVKPLVGLSAITAGVMGVNEGIECTGYLVLPWGKDPHHQFTRMGRCWVASMFAEKLKATGHDAGPSPGSRSLRIRATTGIPTASSPTAMRWSGVATSILRRWPIGWGWTG